MSNAMLKIIELLASFFAVIIVLTLHEFAHAFSALLCGDKTAKYNGRLSLNPLRHFDPLGIIMFTLVGFGWAKPVPINPYNFKHYKSGLFWTASAGVITNYILAFLIFPIYILVLGNLQITNGLSLLVIDFFRDIFSYSLSFCVFNLLPFYPLDGFRIVDALSKKHGKIFQFLEKYGYYILIGLIAESYICQLLNLNQINILGYVMSFATGVFSYPITAFWSLFLFV